MCRSFHRESVHFPEWLDHNRSFHKVKRGEGQAEAVGGRITPKINGNVWTLFSMLGCDCKPSKYKINSQFGGKSVVEMRDDVSCSGCHSDSTERCMFKNIGLTTEAELILSVWSHGFDAKLIGGSFSARRNVSCILRRTGWSWNCMDLVINCYFGRPEVGVFKVGLSFALKNYFYFLISAPSGICPKDFITAIHLADPKSKLVWKHEHKKIISSHGPFINPNQNQKRSCHQAFRLIEPCRIYYHPDAPKHVSSSNGGMFAII